MFGYVIMICKELLSNKRNIILFIATVAVVGALALTAGSKEQITMEKKPNINIGVVDNDKSLYSSLILDYFKSTKSITKFANITLDSQEKMEELFSKGQLLAYLVIPKNLANSLMGSDYVNIEVVINTSNVMYSVLLKNMLDSYGTYITNVQVVSGGLYRLGKSQGMSPDIRNKMNWDTSIELVQLALNRDMFFDKEEVSDISATPILQYYFWAILVLLTLLTATLSGSRFLKERQLGTYERLRIAGHSIHGILFVILMVNSVLWILSFNLLLPVIARFMYSDLNIVGIWYINLCILLANACFLLISTLCRSGNQYSIICTFGLMLISVIGGILIPISLLPERFLVYSRFTPTYYMIRNLITFAKNTNGKNLLSFTLFVFVLVFALYLLCCFILRKEKGDRREKLHETIG